MNNGPPPCHGEDEVEQLQRLDGKDHRREEQRGPHARQRDVAQDLAAVGPVEPGRLGQLSRHSLQARQHEQHREAEVLPDADEDDRRQRKRRALQPVEGIGAQTLRPACDEADLWVEQEAPHQPDGRQGDDRRKEVDRAQDPRQPLGLLKPLGEQETENQLDANGDDSEEQRHLQGVPEPRVVEQLAVVAEADKRLLVGSDAPVVQADPEGLPDGVDNEDRQDQRRGCQEAVRRLPAKAAPGSAWRVVSRFSPACRRGQHGARRRSVRSHTEVSSRGMTGFSRAEHRRPPLLNLRLPRLDYAEQPVIELICSAAFLAWAATSVPRVILPISGT